MKLLFEVIEVTEVVKDSCYPHEFFHLQIHPFLEVFVITDALVSLDQTVPNTHSKREKR